MEGFFGMNPTDKYLHKLPSNEGKTCTNSFCKVQFKVGAEVDKNGANFNSM